MGWVCRGFQTVRVGVYLRVVVVLCALLDEVALEAVWGVDLAAVDPEAWACPEEVFAGAAAVRAGAACVVVAFLAAGWLVCAAANAAHTPTAQKRTAFIPGLTPYFNRLSRS